MQLQGLIALVWRLASLVALGLFGFAWLYVCASITIIWLGAFS